MRKMTLLAMLVVSAFSMGQTCTPDTDSDGVADANDGCPNTPICAIVDARGCPSDSDDDGVYDGCDECPQTLPDTMVYSNGCDAEGPAGSVPARCVGPDPRPMATACPERPRPESACTGRIPFQAMPW